MQKKFLIFLVFGLLLVTAVGCVNQQDKDNGQNINLPIDDSGVVDDDATGDAMDVGDLVEVKEFKIEAKRFEFISGTITVNQGDVVRLIITSTDVDHGIKLSEFDIDVKVPAGETKTVEFVADKKGSFTFNCNVFCGEGHSDMTGVLIVE